MFRHANAFSSFSVDDLAEAKRFYDGTLDLEVVETPEGLELRLENGTRVFIYPSQDNAPADHTVLNFEVDDVDAAIDALAECGVHMEHYDRPDLQTDARGIFRGEGGPEAIAWFKDPAGNVLSVIQPR